MRYYFLLLFIALALPGHSQGGLGRMLNKAKERLKEKEQPNDRSSNPGPPGPPSGGRMLFSSEPFNESGTGVKTATTFTAADHIYCRLELGSPLQEAFDLSRADRGAWFGIGINFEYKEKDYQDAERHEYTYNYLLTPEQLTRNYVNFDLYPSEIGGKSQLYSYTFDDVDPKPLASLFCAQWPGEGKVSFEIILRDRSDIMGNAFTLTAAPVGTTAVACQAAAQAKQKPSPPGGCPPNIPAPVPPSKTRS